MICQHCGFNYSNDLMACPSCHSPNPGINPWAAAFPTEASGAQPKSSNPWVEYSAPEDRPVPPEPASPSAVLPQSDARPSWPPVLSDSPASNPPVSNLPPAPPPSPTTSLSPPVSPVQPGRSGIPATGKPEPADAWGSVFGPTNSGMSEIDAILMKIHSDGEPPVDNAKQPPTADTAPEPTAFSHPIQPRAATPAPVPTPTNVPTPTPVPDLTSVPRRNPETAIPIDADTAIERIPEPEFPQLPEIKLVVPVIPEIPISPSQNGNEWSPETIPMPDSIFRAPEPEPVRTPEPAEESVIDESAIDESSAEDTGVIDDDRTPADLNRQSATRDKKTMTIVMSLAIIMAGIVAIALLLIFL